MGELVELQTARSPLDRMLIGMLAPPTSSGWRREGFNRRFEAGHLVAQPHLVVTARTGALAVSDLDAGCAPRSLSSERALRMVLDCAVVRLALMRVGTAVSTMSAWVRFEDGDYFTLEPSIEKLDEVLRRAEAIARNRSRDPLLTRNVARWLTAAA